MRHVGSGAAILAGTALGLGAVALPASGVAPVEDGGHHYGRALFGVDATAARDAWAVGLTPGEQAAIWHWNGSDWTRSRHPGSASSSVFRDVTARTIDDVWAVGHEDLPSGLSVTYAQHWNGKRWRVVATDPGLPISDANAVDALSADDAWLVGDGQETASGYLIALTEHWDGTEWSLVPGARTGRGCDVSLSGLSAVATNDVWAVGSEVCDGGPEALVEHWNGRHWSKVDVSTPRGADFVQLQDIVTIARDDIWAAGTFARQSGPGRNLVLHWNGIKWSVVPAPDPGAAECSHGVLGISGSRTNDVWAAGTRSCAAEVTPETLHWDGTGWRDVRIPSTGFDSPAGDGLFDVVALSKRSAFTVGIAKTRGQSVEVGFIERWNGSRWALQ
jgi:hypothetical protein